MREVDPVTGCNVGCPAKKHPGAQGSKVMTRTAPSAVVTHRLVCNTCGVETTVATGNMPPEIVEMFKARHFPPHHDVIDEHLEDGKAPDDHT